METGFAGKMDEKLVIESPEFSSRFHETTQFEEVETKKETVGCKFTFEIKCFKD